MSPGRGAGVGCQDTTGWKGHPRGNRGPPWGVGVQARRRDLRGRAGGGTWERVVTHQVSTFIKDHGRKKKTTGARFLTVGKRRYKYIEKT